MGNTAEVNQISRKKYVSVSTEPAEVKDVVAYCGEIIEAGADLLHCDIMDGVAVEKVTYNATMLKKIKKTYKKFPLDVHLMIDDTFGEILQYIRCHPWGITIQYDYFTSERQLVRTLKRIRRSRIKAGVALSPTIPISYIVPYLKYIDIILIMGVVPGLGGQEMIKDTLIKVKEACQLRDKFRKDMIVSFDGGVTYENAQEIFDAGADMVVSGSLVYNCFSRKHAIESLKLGEPIVK